MSCVNRRCFYFLFSLICFGFKDGEGEGEGAREDESRAEGAARLPAALLGRHVSLNVLNVDVSLGGVVDSERDLLGNRPGFDSRG